MLLISCDKIQVWEIFLIHFLSSTKEKDKKECQIHYCCEKDDDADDDNNYDRLCAQQHNFPSLLYRTVNSWYIWKYYYTYYCELDMYKKSKNV